MQIKRPNNFQSAKPISLWSLGPSCTQGFDNNQKVHFEAVHWNQQLNKVMN